MAFPHTIRWRMFAILAVVHVGVIVASEQSAHAYCGDWLVDSNNWVSADDKVKKGNGSSSASGEHEAQMPAMPVESCHGPACRENRLPVSPPDRTPIVPLSISDQAIAQASETTLNAARSSYLLREGRIVRCDGAHTRVDRPPRR